MENSFTPQSHINNVSQAPISPEEPTSLSQALPPRDPRSASPKSEVLIRDRQFGGFSKCSIWVERENFYGAPLSSKKKKKPKVKKVNIKSTDAYEDALPKPASQQEPFLVLGFDTEFKTPDEPVTREELKQGLARYKVLSYQFHAKLYDTNQPDALEWSGICYPEDGSVDNRLSLADFLTFAVWKGVQSGAVKAVPCTIYLVGHFTRADIPAFKDFKNLTQVMSSVRNTFLSIDMQVPIRFQFDDQQFVDVGIIIRDTYLLTPAASKGLKALGELVGVEKVQMSSDPATEKYYKENMDQLLKHDPQLFEKYALTDAIICVRYVDLLLEQTKSLIGSATIPVTLTSIATKLLLKTWEEDQKWDYLELLGKEKVPERVYSKKDSRYNKIISTVNLAELEWHLNLATECYHGGRNEQFWFGPAFEDRWTDYDLTSAYPTAMALIGKPDWRKARVSLRVKDFTPQTLGICRVEFEFPKGVRFPTLPVRTDNGLVFPLKGISDCAAPELALAKNLGAKLKILHGVIVPTDNDQNIFHHFIKKCIDNRSMYPKKTFQNLFWKELSNSTYGKTAQGLHPKRIYDLRDRETKPLPPSKITNPYFASYITSFVRAVLGETINALPANVCVFSCTTDGFLTNAKPEEIVGATNGKLVQLYRDSRAALTGEPNVLEIKHHLKRPLGWRTRGQATLIPGDGDIQDDTNYALAKGGIFLPAGLDGVSEHNKFIVDLFLRRNSNSQIDMKIKTGVRDMVEFDADLVDKLATKRLNMEFDWKRRPYAAKQVKEPNHIAFSTRPWASIDEFRAIRNYWEKIWSSKPFCIKTTADFEKFATSVFTQSALGNDQSLYLKAEFPDLKRLRQSLGTAWRHSKAGLIRQYSGMSNNDFAEILSDIGVSCKRADVENDGRKKWKPHNCPPTPAVKEALKKLKLKFPSLQTEEIVVQGNIAIDLTKVLTTKCPFIERV